MLYIGGSGGKNMKSIVKAIRIIACGVVLLIGLGCGFVGYLIMDLKRVYEMEISTDSGNDIILDEINLISTLPAEIEIESLTLHQYGLSPDINSIEVILKIPTTEFKFDELNDMMSETYDGNRYCTGLQVLSADQEWTKISFVYYAGYSASDLQKWIREEGDEVVNYRAVITIALILLGSVILAVAIVLPYKKIISKIRLKNSQKRIK